MNDIERLRALYKIGTRVRLREQIQGGMGLVVDAGTFGTVCNVDGIGVIHVDWDCGEELGLLVEQDKFDLVQEIGFLVYDGTGIKNIQAGVRVSFGLNLLQNDSFQGIIMRISTPEDKPPIVYIDFDDGSFNEFPCRRVNQEGEWICDEIYKA